MTLACYLDEDSLHRVLIATLRRDGVDVVTAAEMGALGRSDESQLAFAAEQGRVLVSGNRRDFARLCGLWGAQGRIHSGVVLVRYRPAEAPVVARKLAALARARGPADMASAVLYITGDPGQRME